MIAVEIFADSSLARAVANGVSFFIVARFSAGIGVGMASMLSPLYIADFTPARIRGRLVSIYQLAIVLGISMTNLQSYFLRDTRISEWRWMFGWGIIPSLLLCACTFFLQESPRRLTKKGKTDKIKVVLLALGNLSFAKETFDAINKYLKSNSGKRNGSIFKSGIRLAVLIGIGLAVLQKFCGINVVFNYTTTIFESIGFSKENQLLQTIFIGGINLAFTLLSMSLLDKLGRKPLMLIGAVGLTILYIVIAQALQSQSSFTAVYLLAAIGFYATSLAPVTWILISEIFPNSIRATATTIAIVCLWASYFIIAFTFPILVKVMGSIAHTFYEYAGICALGVLFLTVAVKETKGKAFEDMDQMFVH
jgi:SP family xylose:H+ symportor-like MFS transporter